MQCERCRNLLLDHLYDLLDAAEAGAVESHLVSCPACATARERASQDQQLFASAAKSSFPHVTFTPPVEEAPPAADLASPAIAIPRPKTERQRSRFSASALVGWGVAASLLIAIPTLPALLRPDEIRSAAAVTSAAVAMQSLSEAQARQRSLEESAKDSQANAAKIASANKAAVDSPAALRKKLFEEATAKYYAEETKRALDEKRKKLGIEVFGPAAIQPGAPNEYTVVIDDRQDAKGLKQIEVQVRDEKNADRVLFKQPLHHERTGERHQVKLPASLWSEVKADSDLSLVIATVDTKNGLRTQVQDKVRLLAPVYTTMLTTDKPLYRPGERVFFRSLTLDRTSFLPPNREQELVFDLRDPQGNAVPGLRLTGTTNLTREGTSTPILGPDGKPVRGVGSGEFDLPASLAAGDYTLHVHEAKHPAGYTPAAPASRRITVKPFSTDRFQKKLEFGGASFQSGAQVNASLFVSDLERPVAKALVMPSYTADGQVHTLPPVPTDEAGRASFSFTLPANLDIGDARLDARVQLGDVTESLSRRIPVVGRRLAVEFFPEGGQLVAGVPCRVYVRAASLLGEPVDLEGTITDGKASIARIETFRDPQHPGANRGLGRFTFTPQLGLTYTLNLEQPADALEPVLGALVGPAAIAGSRQRFVLPRAIDSGVVMWVEDGVCAPGKPIVVQLSSVGRTRNLVVGAYTRNRLMETKKLTASPGKPAVVHLAGDDNPRGGVTRVTVFEEPDAKAKNRDLKPIAERLVYRVPSEKLDLSFTVNSANGAVADRFHAESPSNLTIRAADEAGRPVAALLYSAVVDANAVAMAEGKLERLLPAHFFLAGEVQKPDDLEHVDFLLSDSPLAARSLDLLLGTQGWRRFAEQDSVVTLQRKHTLSDTDLDGFVMAAGRTRTDVATFSDLRKQTAYEDFREKYEAAARGLQLADAKVAIANEVSPTLAKAREDVRTRQAEYDARTAEAAALQSRAETALSRVRLGSWLAGALAIVLFGAACLVRPWSSRVPFAVGGLASVALALIMQGPSTTTVVHHGASHPRDREEIAPMKDAAKETMMAASPVTPVASSDSVVIPTASPSPPTVAVPKIPGPIVEMPPPPVPTPASKSVPNTARIAPSGPASTGPASAAALPPMLKPMVAPGGVAPSLGGGGGLSAKGGTLMPMAPFAMDKSFKANAESAAQDALARAKQTLEWQAMQARRLSRAKADDSAEKGETRKNPQQIDGRAESRLAGASQAEAEAIKRIPDPSTFGRIGFGGTTATPGRPIDSLLREPSLIVREYAPLASYNRDRSSGSTGTRSLDTILWHPLIVLPANASITLPLMPSADSQGYEVLIAGHTLDGRLGATRATLPVVTNSKK